MKNRLKDALEDYAKCYGMPYRKVFNSLIQSTGISRRHINFLMNDQRAPSLLIAYKIANFLGLQVYDIWELEE